MKYAFKKYSLNNDPVKPGTLIWFQESAARLTKDLKKIETE